MSDLELLKRYLQNEIDTGGHKIFVFDNGRIHEQGTHDELMKLKKRYYTLYKYSNLS